MEENVDMSQLGDAAVAPELKVETGLVAPQFGIYLDLTPGLDGTTWPRMQIVYGLMAFTLTLPMDRFEQTISHLTKEGRMLINHAREANKPKSGLSVAQSIPDNLRAANPAKRGINGKRR